MELGSITSVAVVDGGHHKLFESTGNDGKLTALPAGDVSTNNKGSGGRHASSSASRGEHQQDEEALAAGVADLLNKKAMGRPPCRDRGAPDAGELRKQYHKTLSAKLAGEIAKDLTDYSVSAIEKAIGPA